jgi:hypothetical protein
VGRETASLLIATVRAVPWRELADEAVENLPIIRNAKQLWVQNYPVMASTSTRPAPWCLGQEREVNYVEKENLNGGSAISHGRHADGSGARGHAAHVERCGVEFESTDVESPGSEPRVVQQGRKTRRSTTHERTVNLGNTSTYIDKSLTECLPFP